MSENQMSEDNKCDILIDLQRNYSQRVISSIKYLTTYNDLTVRNREAG